MHGTNRNAYEEVEWLKLQLAVDEDELQVMLLELQNDNIYKGK